VVLSEFNKLKHYIPKIYIYIDSSRLRECLYLIFSIPISRFQVTWFHIIVLGIKIEFSQICYKHFTNLKVAIIWLQIIIMLVSNGMKILQIYL